MHIYKRTLLFTNIFSPSRRYNMTSFSLRPTSIFLPKFVSKRHTILRSFWFTHLSKSEISVRGFIKKGEQAETGGRSRMAFSSGDGDQKRIHEVFIGGEDDEELRVVNGSGFEATFNRLSKWLVATILCAIFIWRQDGEAMWLLTGSVLNTILINVLKRVLNQDRPVSSTLKLDPGMPSSHAQSIFFAAAYVAVSMVKWLGVNGLTLILSSFMFAVGSYLSWLRVSQEYHTVSQVVVGGMLGSALSVVWFWSWGAVVHEAYICHLWARVCIALGTAGFCLGFIAYAIHHYHHHHLISHPAGR